MVLDPLKLNQQTTALQSPAHNSRIHSIDILRGMVMIIMALDHVRDFMHLEAFTDSPTNLATTTPILFFTRFITHYCAPVFIFLSGISAFLAGERRTKKELSWFLISRGLWLVLVELFIVNLTVSFDIHFKAFFLQVIWAIGWSMVILGILVRTSIKVIAICGIVLLAAHNITDYLQIPSTGNTSVWWKILLTAQWSNFSLPGNKTVIIAYAILPWTALMLLGYITGSLYKHGVESIKRRRLLLYTGIGMLLLFLILRITNSYGDPLPWTAQTNAIYTFLSFMNVTKYPVSLHYSLLTLGTALVALAVLEKKPNRLWKFCEVYGKVPLFYYVLHFLLIHLVCMAFFFASGYSWSDARDSAAPLGILFRPVHFGVSLAEVYLLWALIVLALYFPCKWFGNYKKKHKHWWLSYV